MYILIRLSHVHFGLAETVRCHLWHYSKANINKEKHREHYSCYATPVCVTAIKKYISTQNLIGF